MAPAGSPLGRRRGLQAQSLTRIIASLEAAGYIERRRSETDRREIVIEITPMGQDVLAEDMRGRRQWLEHAMSEILTQAECRALQDAAGAMIKLARYEAGKV